MLTWIGRLAAGFRRVNWSGGKRSVRRRLNRRGSERLIVNVLVICVAQPFLATGIDRRFGAKRGKKGEELQNLLNLPYEIP